jgi:hypothetical protein
MTAEIKYFPRKQTKAAMSLAFAALRVEQDDPVLAAYLYKNAVRRLTRIIKVKEIEMQGLRDELSSIRRGSEPAKPSDGLSPSPSQRGIFLDFEGVGSSDDSCPLPHMAGVYRSNKEHPNRGYMAYLFNETWIPVKNGARCKTEIIQLKKFLWDLIAEARAESAVIYYWSQHELRVVEELDDDELKIAFESCSENVKIAAKKRVNRQKLERDRTEKKFLNQYLEVLAPKSPLVQTPAVGPAESCRRIDRYAEKNKRWGNWTSKQKAVAVDLLSYNKADCMALLAITKKVRTDLSLKIEITGP